MSKYDSECQNVIFGPIFDCQNGISNVKMRCLTQIRMSKYDFEFQNAIFGPNSNVKVRFRMSKYDKVFGPNSNVKIAFRMPQFAVRPESNVNIGL